MIPQTLSPKDNERFYIGLIGALSALLMCFEFYLGLFCLMVAGGLLFYHEKTRNRRHEQFLRSIEQLGYSLDQMTRQMVASFPHPLCTVSTQGQLLWYNALFAKMAEHAMPAIGRPFQEVLPQLSLSEILGQASSEPLLVPLNQKLYQLHVSRIEDTKQSNAVLYFVDVTDFEALKKLHEESLPAIVSVQADSFDEVLSSAQEGVRPMIEAELERTLRLYVERYEGAMRKISRDRYVVFLEEKALRKMEAEKFSVLDAIREIDYGNTLPVTLSMGISSMSTDMAATLRNSISSLDLALGRGGDQAVVKRDEKYSFYGGKSKTVEKKTRVKARLIAHALRELIRDADNVLIMGHRYPDLDALGAATGMYSICAMLEKPVHVVLDHPNSSIDILYERLLNNEATKAMFVSKEKARQEVTPNTLLIIVDTHRPSFTEDPELLELCEKVVLIDHHRRGVEFVDKAVLVYHETYVSSASEMVTELIQYVRDRPYIDSLTAESLLSGITLDTKNFTFKTGVRTFEAAGFLRKFGADTIEVKKLFQGDFDSFLIRAEAVKTVKLIGGAYAVTATPENLENPSLIASQIADELLSVKGVKASFVASRRSDGKVFISARSLGEVNVHVLMEKLGGGGHIDTAGAQVDNLTSEEATEKIEELIMEYEKEEN